MCVYVFLFLRLKFGFFLCPEQTKNKSEKKTYT